jgi:hypothetical protein
MTTAQGQELAAAIALVTDKYGYHRLAAMIMPQYRAWDGAEKEFFVKVRNWIRRIPDYEAVEGLDFTSATLNTALMAVAGGVSPEDAYEAATSAIREISDGDADPIRKDSTFHPYP